MEKGHSYSRNNNVNAKKKVFVPYAMRLYLLSKVWVLVMVEKTKTFFFARLKMQKIVHSNNSHKIDI